MAYVNTNPKYGLKAEKISTVQMQTKKFDIALDIIKDLERLFDASEVVSTDIWEKTKETRELLQECIKQRPSFSCGAVILDTLIPIRDNICPLCHKEYR